MTATTTTAAIEALIDASVSIPTVPATLLEINQIFSDPDGSAREAAAVVTRDPAIASKVLRIANSSYYGLRNPVNSIQLAVSILGLRVLKNIVVQATVLEDLSCPGEADGFSATWLWDHSFKVACATRELAGCLGKESLLEQDEAYTCGLLHDVGKVILLEDQREKFTEALAMSKGRTLEMHLAEREVLGFSHAHVGAVLAQRWKLSQQIITAVLCHHPLPDQPEQPPLGRLVGLADRLAHRVSARSGGYHAAKAEDQEFQDLGIPAAAVTRVQRIVANARIEG
jgi:putative nucleotidyltransferase with HDIG domain